MIEQRRLTDLVQENIHTHPISTGWNVCKCQVCNDYKERAGFRFEADEIIYNCWNCATTSRYEEFSGRISKKMRHILNCYGIDDTEISGVVNTAFFKKKEEGEAKITLASLTKVNTNTPTIKLPPKSFVLGHPEFNPYQTRLVAYLLDRQVDFNKYSFFFSLEERFKNRVIIPFFRRDNLIYWQARSIDPSEKKRYDNAPVGRDAIIFNFDKLNDYNPAPLFVTEGVFDAMMVDGIAVLGSKLSDAKKVLLHGTSRRLVFVIDKDSNGKHFAEEVLKEGWEIAFVPDGAEDLNESVRRFGTIYTLASLMKSITKDADKAALALNLNCR